MDWKEELDKKFHELNKEETDGQETNRDLPATSRDIARCNSRSRVVHPTSSTDNSSGSGSRNVLRGNVPEKITVSQPTNLIGGIRNFMINAKGAFSDLDKLIAEAAKVTTMAAATILILQGIRVAVKVILTARTNTVKIMDKLGIPRQTKETPGTVTAPELTKDETED